jgi:hypothetical protein
MRLIRMVVDMRLLLAVRDQLHRISGSPEN